jgi:hypothetical protein
MSESNLTTAAYYEQAEQARSAAETDTSRAPSTPVFSTPLWERAASRFSLIVAGLLVAGAAALGVACFKGVPDKTTRAKKTSSPVDWLLWFGGAKPNQTFESFITDSMQRSEREIEDQLRNPPAYNLRSQPTNWQIKPAPIFKNPAPRSKTGRR